MLSNQDHTEKPVSSSMHSKEEGPDNNYGNQNRLYREGKQTFEEEQQGSEILCQSTFCAEQHYCKCKLEYSTGLKLRMKAMQWQSISLLQFPYFSPASGVELVQLWSPHCKHCQFPILILTNLQACRKAEDINGGQKFAHLQKGLFLAAGNDTTYLNVALIHVYCPYFQALQFGDRRILRNPRSSLQIS